MLTESDIREALRACYDPANPYRQPINIVDLGLIERIALAPDPDAPGAGIPGVPPRQALTLTLIPSTSSEDAQAQIQAQVANLLAGQPALSRVTIYFADTPTWTPTRLTPEARQSLALDPGPFPILNNRPHKP